MRQGCLRFGPFDLDESDFSLWRGDERLRLPPKAFSLLQYLVRNPNRLITKRELLQGVWPDTYVADGVLKVRVQEVRAVLGDDPDRPEFIETVRGRGYRFIATVQAQPSDSVHATPTATASIAPKVPIAGDPLRDAEVEAPATPLVGRSGELKELRERLDLALRSQRQVVLLSGEPGIGKTTLLDAFTTELAAAGGALLGRGQCLEHYGSGEAYLPVLEALGELARGPAATAVADLLRRSAPSWLVQLPWLLTTEDRATLHRELAGGTRERMLREIAETLESLSQATPVVLVLEDMHWSDPSTLDLVSLLAHRRLPARLLVLATYRPVDVILSGHPLKALRARLEQQRLATEIRLPFLTAAQIGEYVWRSLDQAGDGDSAVIAPLAGAILERTAGNPLFVLNVVERLLADGGIAAGANIDAAVRRVRDTVPEGLREMIEQQLERLDGDALEVLETASVAGESFTAETVGAALGDVARVEVICHAHASRHQILMRAAPSDAAAASPVLPTYRFVHSRYRDVLYRRLAPPRRAALHQRVGDWFERHGATPAELASHFVQAVDLGSGDKALAHATEAAARARAVLAYAEAARHLEVALDVLDRAATDRPRRRCELLLALAEAQERAGMYARAVETLVRAADVARSIGADDLFGRAALGVGFHVVARIDQPLIDLLEEACQRVAVAGPLRSMLLARLDAALSPLPGTHERRARIGREAIEMARDLGDGSTLVYVLEHTRWGFSGRESPEELTSLAAALEPIAADESQVEKALHAELLRVALLGERGAIDAARAALDRLDRLATDAGLPWFEWFALRIRTLHAMQAGAFADAERLAGETLELGERMDHPNLRPVFGAQRLHAALLRGRHAEIVEALAAHVERVPTDALSRALRAHALMRSGDGAAAAAELDALAANDFAAVTRDSTWLMSLAHLSEVAAATDDRARARRLTEMIEPHAARIIGVGPSIASLGHGSRYVGLLASCLGRVDAAARHLDIATAAHAAMGARPWLALSLRDQATLLARSARRQPQKLREAADLERRALVLARETGMDGLVAELEDVATGRL